jgi:uncharacterized protein (UPF0262 family)
VQPNEILVFFGFMNVPDPTRHRLIAVHLDEMTLGRGNADQRHERATATWDLVEENLFSPHGHEGGPYVLRIELRDARLVLDIRLADDSPVIAHFLSLTPLRRIIRDYFAICDSYYDAIRHASPSQIETIDMARRGLHNEGSDVLRERLAGKVGVDFATARRLFTLICALHWKG